MVKSKTLYEVLMGKGRSAGAEKVRPVDRPAAQRKPAQLSAGRKSRGAQERPGAGLAGFGERKITITCSRNALLASGVAFVILLAGMFGLGHATAGGRAPDQAGVGLQPAVIPASPAAQSPAVPAPRAREALCVAFYPDQVRGQDLAARMVRFLQENGFKDAKVAQIDSPSGLVVVIPLGETKETDVRAKVRRLASPPFDRRFNFQEREEKMFMMALPTS